MENSHNKNKKIEKKYSNTWYDWLNKVVSLFNSNTPKQTEYDELMMMMKCFCGMVDRRKAFTPYFQPGPFSPS